MTKLEKRKESLKRYWNKNRDKILAREKLRRIAKREELKIKHKIWRDKNREKLLLKQRAYSILNRIRINEKQRLWNKRNRILVRARSAGYDHKRRSKIANTSCEDGASEWCEIVKSTGGTMKCNYCNKPLFKEERVIEHKIPLSRGGGHVISNLCVSCLHCNSCKRNKTDLEFFELLKNSYGSN